MDIDPNPRAFLASARAQARAANHADVLTALDAFEHAYERKLWHQLSRDLDRFLTLPAAPAYLVNLYHQFVRDFDAKLNQLDLVAGLGSAVARHLPDHTARIAFAVQLAERVKPKPRKDGRGLGMGSGAGTDDKPDPDAVAAHLLARTTIAYWQLLDAQYAPVAAFISSTERVIEAADGLDPRVSSAFYRVAADYFKAKALYAKFYKTSLLFLACLGEDVAAALPGNEAANRAYELGVAALMSDEIYNFGELLLHPILDTLDATPRAWIKQMLASFNKGDISSFEKLAAAGIPEPLLANSLPLLRQKICLLALIDYVFSSASPGAAAAASGSQGRRTFSFAAVAKATRLPASEVEFLVMKALALGLIRGTMDQVDETVTVTWVAPRVLDRQQVGDMAGRIEAWCARVKQVADAYVADGGEVFTAA